tara:strand:+ start:73 stop:570 length:498 start_codon:yes stop_codon:yes gene_type:complete
MREGYNFDTFANNVNIAETNPIYGSKKISVTSKSRKPRSDKGKSRSKRTSRSKSRKPRSDKGRSRSKRKSASDIYEFKSDGNLTHIGMLDDANLDFVMSEDIISSGTIRANFMERSGNKRLLLRLLDGQSGMLCVNNTFYAIHFHQGGTFAEDRDDNAKVIVKQL